jgi:tRNA pseudouridine13 synthase
MQAITYQFITLRNIGQHRAERAIKRQLQKGDIELKILCTNIDFVLNIGDLEGNEFKITVRNVKRVKVDYVSESKDNSILKYAKESFVECDSEHIDRMVERIKRHGFINFYGEQRIGAPGKSEEVGVRAFEIGRAMLRQDFTGAIDLLMKGTRHHETDEVRRVRQAWKNSNGNPSITLKAFRGADIMPRERAVLRGLNRYPDNPLEAIRFLSYNMRMFYINAYQSYIFNRVASRRVKLFGEKVVKGDMYFIKEGDHRDNVKHVEGDEVPPIAISQVVLPLPGYNVQYPKNEIGEFYRDLLETDNVRFEKNALPEATANGSYRKLIVYPRNLSADTNSRDSACGSMKLSFQLPKGSYATMLLRELMLTTVVRSKI